LDFRTVAGLSHSSHRSVRAVTMRHVRRMQKHWWHGIMLLSGDLQGFASKLPPRMPREFRVRDESRLQQREVQRSLFGLLRYHFVVHGPQSRARVHLSRGIHRRSLQQLLSQTDHK
jgi:hypothetical protein